MGQIVFDQSGIFHLQKLETQFRKRHKKRFRLSDENGRLDLIRQSSESSDQIIQKYFRNFYHELDPALIRELLQRGIVTTPKGFKMPQAQGDA